MQQILSQSVHGRLYRATDAAGQPVAIKELVFAHAPDAASIEAFTREARLLETLSHPRIPRLRHAFSEGEGAHLRFYLVQDYVAGESLAARLEHHRFDEAAVRDIARQVLEVLVFLHSVQPPVVHRDIKPANLIQREDGSVVLVDFGSARALQQGRTHEATLNGTFGYMAPEQLGGSVSPVSDLYSLGATLLHLLSRRPPETLLRGDWQPAVPREVHVSHHFRTFIKRLVNPRPEARFPSAAAALEALDPPLPRGRPRWPLVAAGAVLMMGVAALVWGHGGSAPWPPHALPPKERKPPPAPGEEQVIYSWEFEVFNNASGFKDSRAGLLLRRSEVDSVQGVQKRAVLLGGKGFLLLEPQEGGDSGLGTLEEGALSMWLSRERPGAGPLVTTYAGNRPVLQLRLDEAGRLRFGMGEHWVQSPRALVPGRFFHVALEWGPTGRRLWMDGERVAQDATPGEALGERLVIGWDERVPGALAPAFVMDQLHIHSGIPPLFTWRLPQLQVPEELRGTPLESDEPARGPPDDSAAPVRLQLPADRDIELSGKASQPRSDNCHPHGRLWVDRMELPTDKASSLTVSFSLRSRLRCRVELPVFMDQGEPTPIKLELLRSGVTLLNKELVFPSATRYSVLTVGDFSEPVARFWIDREAHSVQRMVRVEGKVSDALDGTVPREQVQITALGPSGQQSTVQSGGRYHFHLIPGEWMLEVRTRGYKLVRHRLQVAESGKPLVVNMSLKQEKVTPGTRG